MLHILCLIKLLSFFPRIFFLLFFIFLASILQFGNLTFFLKLDYQLNLNYLIFLLFYQEILSKFRKHHQALYQVKEDLSHHYNLHLMVLLIKHFCLCLLDLYFFHLFSFYRLYSMQLQHCFVVLLFKFFFFLLQ
jgi:hypothetical protein